MRRWLAAALGILAFACGCKPDGVNTQVIARIDAEGGVRVMTRSLVVTVFGGEHRAELTSPDAQVLRVVFDASTWPRTVALAPLGRDPTRVYRVVAEAFADANPSGDAEPLARTVAISGYRAGETLLLDLVLRDDCLGVLCPEEQTCRRRACVDANVPIASLPTVGRDAGSADAAAVDAGSGDADLADTGSGDASAEDAGCDLTAPTLLAPANGASTGSLRARGRGALRPTFRWRADCRPDSFELQVDDSCGSDSEACSFPSPEFSFDGDAEVARPDADLPVATEAPVGRRYYWRVRACMTADGCGPWSPVRYVDVGRVRQQTKDFNGDGFADVVVGARQQGGMDEGSVFVFHGSRGGVPLSPNTTLNNPDGASGNRFGTSVASAGDLNGDGYGDLVVGAPFQGEPRMAGRVFIYFGGPLGLPAEPSRVLDNPDDEDNGRFGSSVASAGDVNGDGFDDLVVGAHLQDHGVADQGNAFVYLGGVTGPSVTPDVRLENPDRQANGFFGASVASTGDVNGDGFDDVVVGAYLQDTSVVDEGMAFVYYGSATGLGMTPFVRLDDPADEMQSRFGVRVASAGDVNGDGYADVAVSARAQDAPEVDEGNVLVYLGGPDGLDPTEDFILDNPANQPEGSFGSDLASADVDGDGFDDLVVGAYLQNGVANREGRVFLYRGRATGLPAAPDGTLQAPTPQGNGYFGWSVAGAGDVDGDGTDDVVVGAYLHDLDARANAGEVFVFFGASGGLPLTSAATLANPMREPEGQFGYSVASATTPGSRRTRACSAGTRPSASGRRARPSR